MVVLCRRCSHGPVLNQQSSKVNSTIIVEINSKVVSLVGTSAVSTVTLWLFGYPPTKRFLTNDTPTLIMQLRHQSSLSFYLLTVIGHCEAKQ